MDRKRICIFIDGALRIPNFKKTYELFKHSMFNSNVDEFDMEVEGTDETDKGECEGGNEDDTPSNNGPGFEEARFFWSKEIESPEVEAFYAKKKVVKEDEDLIQSDYKEYFYSNEHWEKFMEDYSFAIYGDGELPFKKDVDLLNIAQTYLFDVILVDEFYTTRKKSNTFYYLSKIRITPQAVLFLGPGQKVNESTYFGVWNPKVNKGQVNKEGFGDFEMWLKDLEQQLVTA
jgi:hypothetical protein